MNVSLSRNRCSHAAGDSRTYLTNFGEPDILRVQDFFLIAHTSPSGKRVDSDDPIPRKLLNSGKNVCKDFRGIVLRNKQA
jgi:hypothetical protein